MAITGALSALILAIEKVRNWRLNREKLELEVKKLKLETERITKEQELEEKAQEREASGIFYSLIRRLESNPITLVDIELHTDESEDEE